MPAIGRDKRIAASLALAVMASPIEEKDIALPSAVIEEALRLLSAVHCFSQSLLPQLTGDARNLKLAQDVIEVFREYEGDLRTVSQGMFGLSNTERDLVRLIAKSAKNARNLLNPVGENAS